MLNKRIVLGGLIAGAFLLPVVANAGVVSGPCVNCHTMHDSQNGATQSGLNPMLLKGAGCNGCHANGNANNTTTGRFNFGTYSAPQVDDASGTGTLSGGYFVLGAGATDANQHNVSDINNNPDAVHDGVGAVPGDSGSATVGTNDGAGAPGLGCSNCHSVSGGHHGSAVSYRLLPGVGGTEAANYGVGINPISGGNQYDAAGMNTFCAGCHQDFHGAGNQISGGGAWIRHPTGIDVVGNTGSSIDQTMNAGADDDTVPTAAVTTNETIMCITCHFPHGSGVADLLRFAYDGSNNAAGDTTRDVGCETCHSYTVNPGM